MIGKNPAGHRTYHPHDSVPSSQLTRPEPTVDRQKPGTLKAIDTFSKQYMHFVDEARISTEVVDAVLELAQSHSALTNGNFFETHEDGGSFALFLRGKRPIKEGIRVIFSHTDSPCLRVKVNAPLLEWDPDLQPLHTGVELDTLAYGGISPHQWTGRHLELRGHSYINGRRKPFPRLTVFSPEICAHTDTRAEEGTDFGSAHTQESLDLATGYKSVKHLLNALGFKGREDFARSLMLAVPTMPPRKVGPHYISAYGHDNKVCTFAAVMAAIKSKPRLEYATFVLGFDREEVGSWGPGAAKGKFFDKVLHRALIETRAAQGLEDITEALKLDIYDKSLAVNADVDVGATNLELDDSRVDKFNVARLGYGVFVSGTDGILDGDQVSPRLVDRIMGYFERHNIIFQTTGSPMTADRAHYTQSINSVFADRGVPTINIGVPTGSLHSPEELVHNGDLFYTFKAYRAVLESA